VAAIWDHGPVTSTRRATDRSEGTVSAQGLLDAVLESSDDAIFSDDSTARITSWNHTAERIFGYSAEEIVGHASIALFAEHLRGDVDAVFETVMAGDRVNHFETEVLRKDGMPAPISMSLCSGLRRRAVARGRRDRRA
jgi:PAS domain S-box-containing protein